MRRSAQHETHYYLDTWSWYSSSKFVRFAGDIQSVSNGTRDPCMEVRLLSSAQRQVGANGPRSGTVREAHQRIRAHFVTHSESRPSTKSVRTKISWWINGLHISQWSSQSKTAERQLMLNQIHCHHHNTFDSHSEFGSAFHWIHSKDLPYQINRSQLKYNNRFTQNRRQWSNGVSTCHLVFDIRLQ